MGINKINKNITAIVLVIVFLVASILVTIGPDFDAVWASIIGGVLLIILGPVFFGEYGLIVSAIAVIALILFILK